MSTHEEWRPVVGLEETYEVSNLGRIRSLRRVVPCGPDRWRGVPSRVLTPSYTPDGYQMVSVSDYLQDLHSRTVRVHRIVAFAFIGPPPTPQHVINHKDHDRRNNCVDNLEWVTLGENIRHAQRAGRLAHGARQHLAKLDDDKVRAIREGLAVGTLPRILAERFCVTVGTVRHIQHGRTWRHA